MTKNGDSGDAATLNSITAYMDNSVPKMTLQVNSVGAIAAIGGDHLTYIYCFAWDSTTEYLYQSNILISSASAGGTIDIGAGSNMAFQIGTRHDLSGNVAFQGEMGEIFVVNVTPTTQQRLDSYNYLKTKYGL
jgi:hypothetical protein